MQSKNLISDFNFLIVGLARNCEKTIKSDVKRITSALSGSSSLKWLLVESDSNDRTLKLLSDLKSNISDFDFITHGELQNEIPKRTARISFCRNSYIEKINTEIKYKSVDYIIVADFDGINTKISQQGINSCWESTVNWDMCSANQNGPYYDIWALRHKTWQQNDCWKKYHFYRALGLNNEACQHAAINVAMVKIPEASNWIEIDSAFGGLAIYKKHFFDGANYNGLDKNHDEVCEHVRLHQIMKKNGARLYINPKLINTKYTEHTIHLSLKYRINKKINKSFKLVKIRIKNLF
jgi:hypothetical protein